MGNISTPSSSIPPEDQNREAMERFAVLRPHLEEGVPLGRAARRGGVPLRTAERWLARYRESGLAGLARQVRSDADTHHLPDDLVPLIEGMGLKKPRSSAAAIHRRIGKVAQAQGWEIPSYSTVYAILADLDPAMVTLAHEGAAAFRNRYELIHRHRAQSSNAIWQADHTMLDLLILDEKGKVIRPWLTTVMDDYSRAVAGTSVFLGAPSTLNTSLALRQAIWRKADPSWPVCGIPDVLYVDHGSDFTSDHLDQVAASLRFHIVYSAVARPQGRGKIERLFGTLNSELLPELPGHLVHGKPVTPPQLSVTELDRAITAYIANTYQIRVHSQTKKSPLEAWLGNGFLPRLPENLEELDLLRFGAVLGIDVAGATGRLRSASSGATKQGKREGFCLTPQVPDFTWLLTGKYGRQNQTLLFQPVCQPSLLVKVNGPHHCTPMVMQTSGILRL